MGKHTKNNDLSPGNTDADVSRDRELEDILAEYDLLVENDAGEAAADEDLAAILGDAVPEKIAPVEPTEEALPADFFDGTDADLVLQPDTAPTAAAVTAPAFLLPISAQRRSAASFCTMTVMLRNFASDSSRCIRIGDVM